MNTNFCGLVTPVIKTEEINVEKARIHVQNRIHEYLGVGANASRQDNVNLRDELLRKNESLEFQKVCYERQLLPCIQQCHELLQAIMENQVVLVVGKSGCGKTTQVPQMLLDEFIFTYRGTECCIACIQPRKSGAISAAERVAYERMESVGNSVGFKAGAKGIMPRQTGSILYCTSTILINQLKKDPMLNSLTTVIFDNVQEKCGEYHKVFKILKNILPNRPDLKVVLLSTSVSEDTFGEHFKNYHTYLIHEIKTEIRPNSNRDPRKRTRTNDEICNTPSKRRKLSSSSSQPDLEVAIVDRSDPEGRISDNRWLKLEENLLNEMISSRWGNEEISFDGTKWCKGVKIVHCCNSMSLDFLTSAVASVGKIWPKAQLEVIPRSELSRRIIVTFKIQPPFLPMKDVLALIEKQNSGIDTKRWNVIGFIPLGKNSGREYRLFIDENSLKKLRECYGRIKFGFKFINIRIEGNNLKV